MFRVSVAILLSVVFFAGCGGGGSGGGNSTVVNSVRSSVASLNQSSNIQSQVSSAAVSTPSTPASSSNVSSSSSLPASVPFIAWVGESNTVVDFYAFAGNVEFIRTNDSGCNLNALHLCDQVEIDTLKGNKIIDSRFRLGSNSYYSLKTGQVQSTLFVSTVKPGARSGARTVIFKNKIWLIGGSFKNDVWSSVDGKNWKLEINTAAFPARQNHQLIVFKDQMWIVGGMTDTGRASDIWSSSDGISWVLRKVKAEFSSRSEHFLFAFNNKLILLGGDDGDTVNDVWSSVDGVTWINESSSAAFGIRSSMGIVEYNGKLYLVGGYMDGTQNGFKNDIWTSIDGVNWVLAAATTAFSPRYGHALNIYGGKLWLTGGYNSAGSLTDIWSSDDGISWQQSPAQLTQTQMEHSVHRLGNELFMYGGFLRGDVSRSEDGINWADISTNVNLPKACLYFEFNGKQFATDGKVSLWEAAAPVEWQSSPINNNLPAQGICQLITHNNKLYVLGGFVGPLQYRNDIWESADGLVWNRLTSAAGFSPRVAYNKVSFKNKLWTFGGNDFSKTYTDVWASGDGVTWEQQQVSNLPLENIKNGYPRVLGEKLWIFYAAKDAVTNKRLLKAHSSLDGLVWQEENLGDLEVASMYSIFSYGSKLGLVNKDSSNQSLWVSQNGKEWIKEVEKLPFVAESLMFWSDGLYMVDPSQQLWTNSTDSNWRRAYQGKFLLSTGIK